MAHQKTKGEDYSHRFQFTTGSGVSISIEESRTSTSLMRKVKAFNEQAWHRLVETYGDRVYRWSLRTGMPAQDARDVTADVFVAIVRKIKDFRHDPDDGGFRKWVRTITKNKIRDYWRRRQHVVKAIGGSSWQQHLGSLSFESPNKSQYSSHAGTDSASVEELIEEVRAEFSPRDWEIFQRLVLDEQSAGDVASEFGTTVNVVYLVKCRLLKRLRERASALEHA